MIAHERSKSSLLRDLLGAIGFLTILPVPPSPPDSRALGRWAFWFPLVGLASTTSFLVLTVFGVVNLTLVALKRRQPEAAGVMPCPLWVPVAGATASFGLLVAQILR